MSEKFTLEELQHLMAAMNSWDSASVTCQICTSTRQKLEAMIAKEQEKPVKETRELGGHTVTIEHSRV